MKTELIDLSPTRKEIKIEIEPEQIRSAFDRISKEYSKAVKVPGFRPGHAPASVVRTRYKSEIRTEVLRELLPEAVHDAIIEHSLSTLGEPNVEFDNTQALERLGEEPLSLKVGVEVMPKVNLGKYKGLEVSSRMRPIVDEDVNRMIGNMLEASASLEPVEDRASELGDTVTINARGRFVDSPEEEEIKVDDVEVLLGNENVQPEFNENLTGVKPEETRTFTVAYPDDFNAEGLAGKKVEYVADVTSVRKKVLPELDDEWVKSFGEEVETVDALKQRVRENLVAGATFESERNLRNEVIRALVDAHEFELPQSLLEHQTEHRLESFVREMISRGVDPRKAEIDWESARVELRKQAEKELRASLLLEQVADAENITISDEEIEEELDRVAQASNQSKEQVRAALTKNGGERSIAHGMRNRKALDLLVENARITEGEWIEAEEDHASQDEQAPQPQAE